VRELAAPGYDVECIAIGTATDAYQPIERELRITRAIIEVLARARHPLGIVTKSALVERDIDLLAPMAAERLAEVFVSIDARFVAVAHPRARARAQQQRWQRKRWRGRHPGTCRISLRSIRSSTSGD
jgi:DNA repair photolyase